MLAEIAANAVAERLESDTGVWSALPTLSYPGDKCCRIFDDYNYGGSYKTFCLGSATSIEFDHLSDYGWNDRMSSWWCGKSVHYQFCNDVVPNDCSGTHG